MTKITREEVLKIAKLSKIEIKESEIDPMIKHLQDVLTYAAGVKEISEDVEVPSNKNVNVLREDVCVKTDPEPILSQAPDGDDNFFVVPKILDNN
jgi:aspartyl-tRNA(Asn)/glutamyl-tRNA(Gln) amidotransferase subunit C